MSIRVHAFGQVYKWLPGLRNELEIDITEGEMVDDVLHRLGLTITLVGTIRVNGTNVGLMHQLREGDLLEFFPLIGGG